MKYFIDFEATQFSQEIISIGCIREDGQTFYALVAPKKGKITPFITNLTGITAEMIDSAMSADAVFSKFYDWLFENLDDAPEFLVWGNSDGDFIRHTSRHATALKAKMALGYICGNYRDYAKMCKKELKWECNHSLLNTLRRFNSSAEQNHNSLDDAVLLKEVYDFISNTSRETLDEMFADWKRKATNKESVFIPKWNKAGYPAGTICIVNSKKRATNTFTSVEAAALWLKENKCESDTYEHFNLENTIKNIEKAIKGGNHYYGMGWRRVNG
jgi:DNA polymerase III epsilon subunit-like protein